MMGCASIYMQHYEISCTKKNEHFGWNLCPRGKMWIGDRVRKRTIGKGRKGKEYLHPSLEAIGIILFFFVSSHARNNSHIVG